MKISSLFGVFGLIFIFGCTEPETPAMVKALRPVYGSLNDVLSTIKTEDPQPLKSVGKIYVKDDLLFINEVSQGVHVFDNSNPNDPIPLKFISILGNIDIAIKDDFMYADLGNGIATIDISNIDSAKGIDYDNSHLNDLTQVQPPQSVLDLLPSGRKYFECVDKSKGLVIGWEKKEMPQPQCYIN